MFIILLGAPGAGKGTQAENLMRETGLPQIASGDLFRAIRTQETELAALVRSFYDKGALVPDDVTIRMFLERLAEPNCAGGAMLDGFPRTLAQARALDEAFANQGKRIDAVLYIVVSEPELMQRLSGRWICRNNGLHVFHDVSHPSKQRGVCDECGGELYQRVDDKPETARDRLKVFFDQTLPLVDYYRAQKKLADVNGEQAPDAVGRDMLAALKRLGVDRA
ncbi:MAG: adenylate kinase [Dehalococcoidia bacterium]